MPSVTAYLQRRLAVSAAANVRGLARICPLLACHLAALGLMLWSEASLVSAAAFGLTWGVLNFFWIIVLRRLAAAAAV